jgi:hypothetical protein
MNSSAMEWLETSSCVSFVAHHLRACYSMNKSGYSDSYVCFKQSENPCIWNSIVPYGMACNKYILVKYLSPTYAAYLEYILLEKWWFIVLNACALIWPSNSHWSIETCKEQRLSMMKPSMVASLPDTSTRIFQQNHLKTQFNNDNYSKL